MGVTQAAISRCLKNLVLGFALLNFTQKEKN
jgi:hypothetical protein